MLRLRPVVVGLHVVGLETAWMSACEIMTSFARHPGSDVRRTVPKHDAVIDAPAQEANDVAVYQDDILEVQYASPAILFCGEQRGQLADVVGFESTGHCEHDVAVCRALDSQHRSSLYVRAIARPALNAESKEVGDSLTGRDFTNW